MKLNKKTLRQKRLYSFFFILFFFPYFVLPFILSFDFSLYFDLVIMMDQFCFYLAFDFLEKEKKTRTKNKNKQIVKT